MIKLSALLLNRLCPSPQGDIWRAGYFSVVTQAHQRLCESFHGIMCMCVHICIYTYVCAYIHTYTLFFFFCKRTAEEISYNHTQIWIIANGGPSNIHSQIYWYVVFSSTFTTVTDFSPGKSGEGFGMPILHRRKLRLALSH